MNAVSTPFVPAPSSAHPELVEGPTCPGCGQPFAPGGRGQGFAYPEGGQNPRKLRLCRGYLNSIVGPRLSGRDPLAAMPKATASAPPVPWIDPVDEPWIDVPEQGA